MLESMGELRVREFVDGDEAAFRALNVEWIERYFKLEPKDEAAFADPKAMYLDRGGRIFFTLREEKIVGCCALIALAPGEFEVSKMAVTASAQGLGVGRFQMEAVIAAARAAGATRLYLETNHALAPALRLYEAAGFRHVPKERLTPSPYARADVFMELWLS
jgi:putative acetyltransferase